MESIGKLERQVMQNMKKAAPEDVDILARHYWDWATHTDDYRDRRKLLKRASFLAGLAFSAGADSLEQLELYGAIIQRGTEVASSTGGRAGQAFQNHGQVAGKNGRRQARGHRQGERRDLG